MLCGVSFTACFLSEPVKLHFWPNLQIRNADSAMPRKNSEHTHVETKVLEGLQKGHRQDRALPVDVGTFDARTRIMA